MGCRGSKKKKLEEDPDIEIERRMELQKKVADSHEPEMNRISALDITEEYKKSETNFWQETKELTIQLCEGLFNDVSSSLVRSNLLHAGQAFCKDLIQEEEISIKNSIRLRIEKEILANRLSLSKVGLTSDELANTLHYAPFGITIAASNQNNIAFVDNLMAVFKTATSTD